MMRRWVLLVVGIISLWGWSFNQSVADSRGFGPVCQQCGANANNCGCQAHQPNYGPCDKPCDKPCNIPREGPTPREGPPVEDYEPEEFVTRETGFYQAPPAVGSYQAPAKSFGLGGGGIKLPEIHLKMPVIELPSLFRTRESAKMRIASTEAPWVSTGFERVRMRGGAAVPAAAPQYRGGPTEPQQPRDAPRGSEENCEGARREYERKIEELNRKLQDCEELKKCIQDCLEKYPQMTQSSRRGNSALRDEEPSLEETSMPVHRMAPPEPPADETRVRRRQPAELTPASYAEPWPLPSMPSVTRLPPPSERVGHATRLPEPVIRRLPGRASRP